MSGRPQMPGGTLLMMDPTNAIAIDHRSTSKAVKGESK